MKKIISLILCLLFIPHVCFGGVNISGASLSGCELGGDYAVSATDYSDITFYLDCDDLGDADKSAGSSTITWSANTTINTTTKKVGSGSVDCGNANEDAFTFQDTDNLDFDSYSCRFGFYMYYQDTIGALVYMVLADNQTLFRVRNYYSSLEVRYRGTTSTITTGLVTATWYFVEFALDGDTMTVYVNGVSKGTVTGTATGTVSKIKFVASMSGANPLFDNIICSNDNTRDLYAISTATNFS